METICAAVQPAIDRSEYRCVVWKQSIHDSSLHRRQKGNTHGRDLCICACFACEQYRRERVVLHEVL